MKRPEVLHWQAGNGNKRLIRGLREIFRKSGSRRKLFTTVRLTTKWADKLNLNDVVAISVNSSAKPKIVGHAVVVTLKKGLVKFMARDDRDLATNIGAKKWTRALKDMQSVYQMPIGEGDRLSIIQLIPEK